MENGPNGRRNSRRIANCGNQEELTLNQIRKWYQGGVRNGRIKDIDNIKQDECSRQYRSAPPLYLELEVHLL